MRRGIADSVAQFIRSDIPKPPSATVGVQFDSLSPNLIQAITKLESRVLTSLKDDNKEVVRAYIEKGLREGISPAKIAKDLKNILGLSPNQLEAIANYKDALERGAVKAAESYKLRDKRLKVSPGMTREQIEKSVNAYTERMVRHNAETVARTAALDSQKLAQHLSWVQAVEQGIINPGRLYKRWVGVKDLRERESHLAMEGEVVPYDQPYSNGQMIPGDTEYNCRCISQYFQRT